MGKGNFLLKSYGNFLGQASVYINSQQWGIPVSYSPAVYYSTGILFVKRFFVSLLILGTQIMTVEKDIEHTAILHSPRSLGLEFLQLGSHCNASLVLVTLNCGIR